MVKKILISGEVSSYVEFEVENKDKILGVFSEFDLKMSGMATLGVESIYP